MHPTSQTPAGQHATLTFPIAFELCRMSPLGVASMVHHLSALPRFDDQPAERLEAMAIAFLASGGADDNDHAVLDIGVHRVHQEAHSSKAQYNWREYLRKRYRRTVMDLLTWLDRLSGGGSLMIHASGTRPPSAPATVEEQKLDVFAPRQAVNANIGARIACVRIIQHFAENIGYPIMQNWDRAKGLQVGGPRHRSTAQQTPSNRNAGQPLLPMLKSPAFTLYPRPPGTIELLIAEEFGATVGQAFPVTQPHVATTSNTAPSPAVVPTITLPPPPSTAPTSHRGASGPSYHVRVKSEELDGSQELSTAHSSGEHAVDEGDGVDIIEALVTRIAELEDLCESQGEEIGELRAVVEASMRHNTTPRPAVTPRRETGSVSPADTFGRGKGKARARREHAPPSATLRSPSSISSVSSVSTSPPPSTRASTPSASRTASRADNISRSSRTVVTGTPQTPRRRRTSGDGDSFHCGYYTDHAVAFYGLPLETFALLTSIQRQYPSAAWGFGILTIVPDVDRDAAEAIASAMRKDLGLVNTE